MTERLDARGYLHHRSNDFGKVPIELITDTTISPGAVRLYAYMHWRYGSNMKNFESHISMAKALGVTRRTVINYIAELEASDWIAIVRRTYKRLKTSNFYHVFEVQSDCQEWKIAHPDRPTINEQPLRADVQPISHLDVQQDSHLDVQPVSHNPDSIYPDTEEPSSPPPSGDENATAETGKPPRKRSEKQQALDAIMEALVVALGYNRDAITEVLWGELRTGGKQLLGVKATPEDMPGLYAWCERQRWNGTWGAMAMAKNWANYEKSRPSAEPKAAYGTASSTGALESAIAQEAVA